ncbi:MAG: hypothetical protein EAZ36_00520, partial [Verrucomicrobia bacterium]
APPITVPKRSLRSWEEMRSVRVARDYVFDEKGALTSFGTALRENLSLYKFEGVNANALAPALGTARGWDSTQQQQLAGYRAGKGQRPAGAPAWFRGPDDLKSILGANADIRGLDGAIKLLRVETTVTEGLASMTLISLVALADGVELPAVTDPAAAGASPPPAPGTPGPDETPKPDGPPPGSGANPPTAEERLNYPFTLLEVVETNAPPPTVLPEEDLALDSPF